VDPVCWWACRRIPPSWLWAHVAQGIGEVLTFAIGVAISPVPIIAVILMLFSGRAKVNGPMFLVGWVVALAVVSGAAYFLPDAGGHEAACTAAQRWPSFVTRRDRALGAARYIRLICATSQGLIRLP
jgi:hypothetical protein